MELPRDLEALRNTPLHTITQRYGQVGLEARFSLELDRFQGEDRALILDAEQLALQLHSSATRGREPYANHVLRVGIRVMSHAHLQVDNPEVIAAGFLHDSVEDEAAMLAKFSTSPKESERATALSVLSSRFGAHVAAIVAALSNPEFDKKGDWMAAYVAHVRAELLAEPDAIPDKLGDWGDNGHGIMHAPAERRVHFATKYRPLIALFRELIPLETTPLKPEVKRRQLDQLSVTEARFDGILRNKMPLRT